MGSKSYQSLSLTSLFFTGLALEPPGRLLAGIVADVAVDGELLFVKSDDKWEELYLDIDNWNLVAGQGGDVALPGGEGVRQAARLL